MKGNLTEGRWALATAIRNQRIVIRNLTRKEAEVRDSDWRLASHLRTHLTVRKEALSDLRFVSRMLRKG